MGKFVVGERYKVGGDSCETGNIIEITRMDRTWCYYKTVEGEHAPDGFMPNSEFGRALIPVTARKFKVGDKVIGNDLADENYGITCKGYKGIVTDVLNNGKSKLTITPFWKNASICSKRKRRSSSPAKVRRQSQSTISTVR